MARPDHHHAATPTPTTATAPTIRPTTTVAKDVCPNIPGKQAKVPPSRIKQAGKCVTRVKAKQKKKKVCVNGRRVSPCVRAGANGELQTTTVMKGSPRGALHVLPKRHTNRAATWYERRVTGRQPREMQGDAGEVSSQRPQTAGR